MISGLCRHIQVFGLAVLDNAVNLGAIIFAVHLPSATGGEAGRAGSSARTVASDSDSNRNSNISSSV